MEETQATVQWQRSSAGRRHISTRWVFLAASAFTLLLLGVLPPLISVKGLQHRISTSIGRSLGRPVHFDHVSLNLLPLPSFTITNFVVEEDPAFGAEPIIRAHAVTATLRFSSLWRRQVEFSRISFAEPSLNLVHDRSGRWNFEGILLHAAQVETAPTGQPGAGSAPRFPYIEATGARLNLKQGIEKTPFSLSETDFALWLPNPREWKMRLSGRPVRTDTSVSDTGTLQIEATLGRADSLDAIPLDVEATWRNSPLGQASRLFLARDLGLRGDVTVDLAIRGNLDQNSLATHLRINGLRRSDFVPEQTLSVDLQCTGTATRIFHSFSDVHCTWPVPDSEGATLALAASIPHATDGSSAQMELGIPRLPAAVLLNWLRVATSRIPPSLSATGVLSGSISHAADGQPRWLVQATMPELQIAGGSLDAAPLVLDDVLLHSPGNPGRGRAAPISNVPAFLLSPVALPLGGREPAILEGSIDRNGYTLHLTGMVLPIRLSALGTALPQFGDGLATVLATTRTSAPIRVDLSAYRHWDGGQVWVDNLSHPGPPPSRLARSNSHRPKL